MYITNSELSSINKDFIIITTLATNQIEVCATISISCIRK